MAISFGLHAAVLVLVHHRPARSGSITEGQTPQIIPVDIVQIDEKTAVKQPEPKPEDKPKPKPEPPKPQRSRPRTSRSRRRCRRRPTRSPICPSGARSRSRRSRPSRSSPVPVNVKPRAKPKPPKPQSNSIQADIADASRQEQEGRAPLGQPQQQSIDTARLTASLQDAIRSQVQSCWLCRPARPTPRISGSGCRSRSIPTAALNASAGDHSEPEQGRPVGLLSGGGRERAPGGPEVCALEIAGRFL